MKNQRQFVGLLGENLAIQFLKNEFDLLHQHYATHWGELDVVARKGDTIGFVEVKTRVGDSKEKPYEAIDYYKRRSLHRAIKNYLSTHSYKEYKYSLDVISIF